MLVLVTVGGLTFRRTAERRDEAAVVSVPKPRAIRLRLGDGVPGQQIDLRWSSEGADAAACVQPLIWSRDGWRPETLDVLPGNHRYTLHRRSHKAVAGQGVFSVSEDTEEVTLSAPIPPFVTR